VFGAPGVLVGVPAFVRAAGRCRKIFVLRLRSARRGASHALLSAFTLAWRLDAAETVGLLIEEVVGGGFVNLIWTHRSTLIWPHPGLVAAGL
jgi:hypothetical protein